MRWWLGALFVVGAQAGEVVETIELGTVWSGHPVGFDLLTTADRQYVAFYDAERQMTIGSRRLDEPAFQQVKLPSRVGWDSHNYITLALDRAGQLHVSGNMHVNPLVYFRTTTPGDIASLQKIEAMVGEREQRVTYPRFFTAPDGALVFTYRDGSSGNGDQVYNLYDEATQRWTRLLDTALTSGEGKMNAYLEGPTPGPDGFYHLLWVWRDTPDCATNHDLSYARSRDLRHWETSDGRPLTLPITLATAEIIDPVPPGGGLINGCQRLGFDTANRLVVTWHKHDENGHTNIYAARRETDGWRIRKVSNWDWRWEFSGGGSIGFEIGVSPVRVEEGQLLLGYRHAKFGSGTWLLDPDTLQPTGKWSKPSPLPAEHRQLEGTFEGLQVRLLSRPDVTRPDRLYFLRWETLGPNRDRPRPEAPPPSRLRLLTVQGP